MNLNQSYKDLITRIKKVRATQNIIDFGSSILLWAGITSLIILASTAIEYSATGDEKFREFLFFGALASIGAGFLTSIFKPVLRIFSEKANYSISDIALKIGNSYPEIKDRLLNAMQLKRATNSNDSSSSNLADAAFDRTYTDTKDKDFSVILDKSGLKRSLLFLVLGVSLLGASFSISDSIKNAGVRILKYNESFLPPIPFKLFISEIDSKVKRGSDVNLKIRGEGELPETIELYLKEAQQDEYNVYKLRLDTGSVYKFSIKSLKTSLSYFAEGKYLNQSTFSDTSSVNVFDLPFVKNISGRVNFPSYAKITPQILTNNNADITALTGSKASFQIKANTNLDSAKIEFTASKGIADTLTPESKYYNLDVNKDSANGSFNISKTGSYKFRLYSDGLVNESPIEYRVLALTDDDPNISLVQPKSDVQLNSKAILPIVVDVSDDYGLGNLYLYYKLTFSKYVEPDPDFQKIQISYEQKGKSIEIPYVWDLNEIGISPEDKFEFYLEIFDNDNIRGPKSAKTPILKLRLPSLDEAFEEAEVAQKEIENELDKVLKESQELNEKIEELKNDLRKDAKNKKMDWQQQKESKDVFNKREDLKEKVEQLSEKLDQTSKQMQDNEMLSKETLEKYKKLQELMKEVSRPDLEMKSQELKQNLEKMTPEQMRKALEKTQLNDEQFRQQIDRSMKMLKKIQAEQKMDEIAKKAKEMEQEQKEIQDALNKDNLSKKEQNKLKNKQKALQDKLNDLEQEMKELSELIKESGDKEAAKDFEQAVNKLNPEQTKKDLQDAEKKMDEAFQKQENAQNEQQENSENQQQNQAQQQQQQSSQQQQANQAKKQAQQKQQNAQKKMSEFAQKMQEMKQKMQQKAMEKMMKDMKKSISDLLELSEKQEQLKDQTQGLNNNSNKLPDIQNKQGDINQSLNSVARKLMEMSEKSFAVSPEMGKEISKAMKEMGESAKQLSERRPSSSSKNQKESMTALNKAAMQMQAGMQKMKQAAQQQAGQQQPGGPGMGEGQGQGQKPSPSFGQQLQQAAAQQQLLKQSMQQMMQQQKQSGGKQPGGQGGSGGESGQNPKDKKTGQYGKLKNEIGNAQKSLNELAEEQKKSSGGNEKMESELRKISKEMQEVMADIESGNVNDKTLEKQERILSRLLDASRSVNERDKQKKRQAKTGKDYSPQNPSDVDWESRQRKKQLEDMLKQLEVEYTKDYELIIKKYFEELKKIEVEEASNN